MIKQLRLSCYYYVFLIANVGSWEREKNSMLRARTQALKSDVALRCPRDRERESERAREKNLEGT